jgi:hypothetical protein
MDTTMKKDIFEKIAKFVKEEKYHKSFVDVDYDKVPCGRFDCDHEYGRCNIITNCNITNVDIDSFIENLYKENLNRYVDVKNNNEIDHYCLDRIVRAHSLYDESKWKANIVDDYYGPYVSGGTIIDPDDFIKSLELFIGLSDIDKIQKCLILEYGYLLERLGNFTDVKISTVDLNKIDLPNENYGRKLKVEDLSFYENYQLPRAICTAAGEYYSIIDGYHRIISAKKLNLKEVKVIVFDY